jgi:hypothetical protein
MIRKSLKRRRSRKSDEPAVYLGLNLLVGGRRPVSDARRMLSRISSVGTAVLLAARVQHPQAGTRGCLPVGAPITCGKKRSNCRVSNCLLLGQAFSLLFRKQDIMSLITKP